MDIPCNLRRDLARHVTHTLFSVCPRGNKQCCTEAITRLEIAKRPRKTPVIAVGNPLWCFGAERRERERLRKAPTGQLSLAANLGGTSEIDDAPSSLHLDLSQFHPPCSGREKRAFKRFPTSSVGFINEISRRYPKILSGICRSVPDRRDQRIDSHPLLEREIQRKVRQQRNLLWKFSAAGIFSFSPLSCPKKNWLMICQPLHFFDQIARGWKIVYRGVNSLSFP